VTLTLSDKGIAFIKSFEKFSPVVYLDQAGLPSIGYGHKVLTGEIWPTEGIDEDRATQVFVYDLGDPQRAVRTLVRADIQQQHFDALTSLVFNIGSGSFRGSTVLDQLNRGNFTGAGNAIIMWNKVHDPKTNQLVVSAGLDARRKAERDIFLNGIYTNHS
jgi:lysozyme